MIVNNFTNKIWRGGNVENEPMHTNSKQKMVKSSSTDFQLSCMCSFLGYKKTDMYFILNMLFLILQLGLRVSIKRVSPKDKLPTR